MGLRCKNLWQEYRFQLIPISNSAQGENASRAEETAWWSIKESVTQPRENIKGQRIPSLPGVQEYKVRLLDRGYQVTEKGQERGQQPFLLGSLYLFSISYHLVLVGCPLKHALSPLDVEEDVGKDSDGILVTSHHEVREAHVVVSGHLALRHPRVHALRRMEQQTALEGRQSPSAWTAWPSVHSHTSQDISPHTHPCRSFLTASISRSFCLLRFPVSAFCKQSTLTLCITLLCSTPILASSLPALG